MQPQIIEKIKEIVKKHKVSLAYLFGSQSRGTAGPMSDVDLGILFPQNTTREEISQKENTIYYEMSKVLNSDNVDIINLGAVQDPLLKYNIVIRGKIIYCADELNRFVLESDILKEYEDTSYLRRVQYELMERRIKQGTFGHAQIKSGYLEKKHGT